MSDLARALRTATGRTLRTSSAVGGGSINAAARVDTDAGPVFVKSTAARNAAWFDAEADGLAALGACAALRVPAVLGRAADAQTAYLFLEWVDLRPPQAASHARMGEGLAALHEVTGERFGWSRDNFIGATPQANGWDDDWCRFFADRRLGPQLALARGNGHGGALIERGERVAAALPQLLAGAAPLPRLIHGDLWGGNWGVDEAGRAVVYDPAVHFADAACDIAMTRLFGGFGAPFYRAYEARHGTVDETRIVLYQLYHVLNHLNLFGGGYAGQALRLMERLL